MAEVTENLHLAREAIQMERQGKRPRETLRKNPKILGIKPSEFFPNLIPGCYLVSETGKNGTLKLEVPIFQINQVSGHGARISLNIFGAKIQILWFGTAFLESNIGVSPTFGIFWRKATQTATNSDQVLCNPVVSEQTHMAERKAMDFSLPQDNIRTDIQIPNRANHSNLWVNRSTF